MNLINKIQEIKRIRFHISSSIDRLEEADKLEESPSKIVFLKRESSILVKRSWSMLWRALFIWSKIRLHKKNKKV